MILPHGLDDLQHGVDVLLSADPHEREVIANKITVEVGCLNATAATDLLLAVQRFAAWGGDPTPVREAFTTFAAECGPHIGAQHHKHDQARRNQQSSMAVRSKKSDLAEQLTDPIFASDYRKLTQAGRKRVGHATLMTEARKIAAANPGDAPAREYLTDHYAKNWLKKHRTG